MRPSLIARTSERDVGIAREHHADGRAACARSRCSRNSTPLMLGHHLVDDHQRDRPRARGSRGRRRPLLAVKTLVVLAERELERLEDRLLVVDDEDANAGAHARHRAWLRCCRLGSIQGWSAQLTGSLPARQSRQRKHAREPEGGGPLGAAAPRSSAAARSPLARGLAGRLPLGRLASGLLAPGSLPGGLLAGGLRSLLARDLLASGLLARRSLASGLPGRLATSRRLLRRLASAGASLRHLRSSDVAVLVDEVEEAVFPLRRRPWPPSAA